MGPRGLWHGGGAIVVEVLLRLALLALGMFLGVAVLARELC